MTTQNKSYLVGRQPILDRHENLFAYELLFRATAGSEANVDNPFRATAHVIMNTLSSFGITDMLGGRKGFINIDLEMLMGDTLELLPKDQIVIELLESIEPTPEVVERCRCLKEEGFLLALDDHEYHPRFIELYAIVDLVKIDLLQTPLEQLPVMVERLKGHPFKILAEKVESRDVFENCLKLGFEYFQGYYFAKPAIMEKKKMSEDVVTLLKLLRLLSENANILDIELAFRSSPSMTYKMLLLVNSVAYSPLEKIHSIRHAISMVGLQQIRRWVQLALFASDGDDGFETPLVDMAAVRAGFMEQLANVHPSLKKNGEAPEQAFMTGILSLLERMFDVAVEDIIASLNLSSDLTDALLFRRGHYGEILRVAEHLEELEFKAASDELTAMGISLDAVFGLQVKAFNWK